eukprot:m.128999 g.128999  ORF g.128999 m.128999 type:complete len:505 (+) comp29370_c0_seq3:100-1614(+)
MGGKESKQSTPAVYNDLYKDKEPDNATPSESTKLIENEKTGLIAGNDDGPTRPAVSDQLCDSDLVFDADHPDIDPKLVTASVFSSVFNLTNTIVGAGVLALPFAFGSTGVILGTIVLFGVFLLIQYSIDLLITCTKYCKASTYHGIAQAAFGKKGVIITHISIFITTFGTMTSYLVIIGDMVAPMIGLFMGGTNDAYCSQYAARQFPITLALFFVIPLSILRNIDSLRYTSILAVVSVLYLLAVVVYKSGQKIIEGGSTDDMTHGDFLDFSDRIFRALPIMTLAFTCHMNVFTIVAGLRLPTVRRVRHVTQGSLTICWLIYTLIGIFGFLTFYTESSINGNLLLNYDVEESIIVAGRIAVFVVVLFSYPMLSHPCIASFDGLFFPDKPFSYIRRSIEVFFIAGANYLIAFFVSDVSLVLGLAGAIGSTAISFVLPALFYMRLHPSSFKSRGKIMAILLLIVGILSLFISTIVTLIDAFDTDEESAANICNRTLYDIEHNTTNSG